MPAQTVVTKRPRTAAPQDRKAPAPKGPAANPRAIDLADEDDGPIEIPVHFLRDDKQWYTAHPIKGTVAIALGEQMEQVDREDLAAMRAMLMEFLGLMFPAEVVAELSARLDDPQDRFDLPHIQRLVKRLSEKSTGLPTT